MAEEGVFEGLVWEEVGNAPNGGGSGVCRDIDRPVPAGLGRPHPGRARQFAPFAALRGYYDARELAETVAHLRRGQLVRAVFYENNAYRTIIGTVSQIDMIYHDLWIVRTRIPFDELCALEALS